MKGQVIIADAFCGQPQDWYMKGAMSFMSKIIAVTSGKGGTGKSSISACLGYALASRETVHL